MLRKWQSVMAISLGVALCSWAIAWGAVRAEHEDTEKMRACVAAGKQWVRDGITAYYECVENR